MRSVRAASPWARAGAARRPAAPARRLRRWGIGGGCPRCAALPTPSDSEHANPEGCSPLQLNPLPWGETGLVPTLIWWVRLIAALPPRVLAGTEAQAEWKSPEDTWHPYRELTKPNAEI